MNISKIIIHEIIKEQRSNRVSHFLTSELLPIEPQTQNLVEKLDNSFKRDKIMYAIFNENVGAFPLRFNNYSQSNNNDAFIDFTRNVILELSSILGGVIFAKGGYFVFAEYRSNQTNYLSIFLIRDAKGVLFNKNQNQAGFTINEVDYLNIDKLAMGCRINLDKYGSRDGKYIAIIKNQQEISDYFNQWISVVQPESSTDYTNNLYNIISNINPPQNPNTGEAYSIDEFRRIVYNQVTAHPNKIINLQNLGAVLYNNEDAFVDYAMENGYEIDTEFKADGRALRKFLKFEILSDGINLKFSRGDLGHKVRLSEENPDQVIIESSRFANKFRVESNDI